MYFDNFENIIKYIYIYVYVGRGHRPQTFVIYNCILYDQYIQILERSHVIRILHLILHIPLYLLSHPHCRTVGKGPLLTGRTVGDLLDQENDHERPRYIWHRQYVQDL